MPARRPKRGDLPHACHTQLVAVERRLLRAISTADRRGYTGYVNGKGGLFDDPRVKAIIRRRDRLLDGKCSVR